MQQHVKREEKNLQPRENDKNENIDSVSYLHADLVQLGSWKAHPLNKALLTQAACQPSLLLASQRILNAAAKSTMPQQAQHARQAQQAQQLLQQLLLPFVSFVLLQPDPQGEA